MSESTALNLGHEAVGPLGSAAVGCIFSSADAFASAVERLIAADIPAADIHVGTTSPERANELSQRTGAIPDIAADDPLRGMHGYAGEATARRAVDRAGVWGAVAGVAVGAVAGRTPLAGAIPVSPAFQPLSWVLFCFVLGSFVGSILGAALAPQRSTHAAFRLIDGMSDGGIALIVIAPAANAEQIANLLAEAGGTDLTRL